MNETEQRKKREWIKNAAIIFLVIMLLLTFFSNTIMNYSLPQVATQTVNPGSITAKVRGSGTVTANDPFHVIVKDTRLIESISVKKGDEVKKGDVLFVLEEGDSKELEEAELALNRLVLEYKQALLGGTLSSETIHNIENGKVDSLSSYISQMENTSGSLDSAQSTVDALQNSVNYIQNQITLAENSASDVSAESTAVNSARSKLASAQADYTKANERVTSIQAILSSAGSMESATEAVNNAEADKNAKEQALNAAKQEFSDANASGDADRISKAQAALDKAQADFDSAVVTYDNAVSYLANVTNTLAVYTPKLQSAQKALSNAAIKVSEREADLAKAQAKLDNKTENSSKETQIANLKQQLTIETANLTAAQAALENAKENQSQVVADIQGELGLSSKNLEILKQKELVEKLKSSNTGSEVVAQIDGTITAVNCVAGDTTKPEEPLAIIQSAEKGFNLEISVPAEQAKKVKPGDPGEIQEAWQYGEIKAKLTSIKTDPENPSKNKLLVFDVTGDVQADQNLSIAVGQKSQNYDLIVPNSAIREDSNGKFILTLESKSTPLGNRYIATRVDIEELASDDKQTAISAGLYGYEYVITTSTKPVEAGKQVRLAD